MATDYDFGLDISKPASADLSARQYRAMSLSSGEVATAAADADAVFILQNKDADAQGRMCKLRWTGPSRGVAGAAFAENARLKVGTDGKLIAVSAATDPSVALALEAAGADNDIVEVLVQSQIRDTV